MATTQQLLDLKYDLQLAQNQIALKGIFSESILGSLANRAIPLKTYQEIVSTTTYTHKNKDRTTIPPVFVIKGLEHLTQLSIIDLGDCNFTSIGDISGLAKLTNISCFWNKLSSINVSALPLLTTLYLHENKLTTIGVVDSLINLVQLNVSSNLLTAIGKVDLLVNLVTIDISSNVRGLNQITTIGNVGSLTKLVTLNVSGNAFTSSNLTLLLSQLQAMLYPLTAPNRKLLVLNISGATMPIPTAADLLVIGDVSTPTTLRGMGVTVTYRTV